MPIPPKTKANSSSAWASEPINTDNLAKACLFKVNSDLTIEDTAIGRFSLNPSSWEEAKTANWSPIPVPGQSDPVLQWINSGPRTVSFEALITNDISTEFTKNSNTDNRKNSNTFVAQIAASISNVSNLISSPKLDIGSITSSDLDREPSPFTLDISKNLNYFRSLLYPLYDTASRPSSLKGSPPLLILVTGKTFEQISARQFISSDSVIWVLTGLRIRITKQTNDLNPMEAVVNFELMQYIITPFGRDHVQLGSQQ